MYENEQNRAAAPEAPVAPAGHGAGPLELAAPALAAIVTRGGASRAELVAATGLSRATLGQRLAALVAAGLVVETEATVPSGGRPTRLVGADPAAAVIPVADVGESHMRLAILDLGRNVLAEETLAYRIGDGPVPALEAISGRLEALLAAAGGGRLVAGVGISLPAPVDHRIGRVFGPSILAGWDDFPIGHWLARRFGAPAIVENDVNLLTVFEHRRSVAPDDHFFFVKVGTGIGSGIITEGRLNRGAQGAAGDIGHMQIIADPAPLCRCGKLGCLESRAAGWALARDLRALGFEATDARDVVALVEARTPEAIQLVRASGRALGAALSDVIAVLNPGRIVVGGTLSRAYEHLQFGIRETIFQRCLPLATRDLVIEPSPPVDDACLVGAAHCVIERVFSPGAAGAFLGRYAAWTARAAA